MTRSTQNPQGHATDAAALAQRVRLAKSDDDQFALLARDFERHNRHLAYNVTGHFIDEHAEEWSVVLLAFHEAVVKYDPDRGSFTSFSDLVIRRRLIDHLRSRKLAEGREIPADIDAAADLPAQTVVIGDPVTLQVSHSLTEDARRQETRMALALEIDALSSVLAKYDITFQELTKVSPKAGKTRRACAKAVRALVEHPDLLASLRRTGTLPVTKICEIADLPRKIPERHRKYIITAAEILDGDYPCLSDYVDILRKEWHS